MFRLLTLALLLTAASLSAAVKVTTKPSEVTLYPQGARVLRTGSAQLGAGESSLLFEGIPAEADEGSLRLSVEGPRGTKLFGVRFAETHSPEALLERRKVLEAKIQDLEDEKAEIGDRSAARLAEVEILKALAAQGAKDAGASRSGLGALATDVAGIGRRLAELASVNRKEARVSRELDKKLLALRQDLEQLGSESRGFRSAEADIALSEAGTVSFSLIYNVASAGWKPVYDLRLGGTKVALTFSGEIRQKTGEDWNGVKLELSTARPAAATEVPDPSNWWLDFEQAYAAPRPKRSKAMSAPAAMEAAGTSAYMMAEDAYETGPAEVQYAQTVSAAFSTSYAVKRPMNIPSDNTAHRVAVAESSHDTSLLLVVVPRLDQAAYIEATVAYSGEQQLLPGEALLFREGDFVGKTWLKATAPGEEIKLGFGKDDRVTVKRELVAQKSGQGGLFTKGKRRYEWLTKLNNYHDSARKVEVREQLPRSRQQDIKVELLEAKPKPQAEDPAKPGLLRWDLELKPKQEQKVTLIYEVKHPEDRRVTGME